MRRTFVIALAILTVALTGGTCEFSASSNNSIHSDPPKEESNEPGTGLLVLIDTGGLEASGNSAAIELGIIETALATSVLSVPSHALTPSTDSLTDGLQSRTVLELSTVQKVASSLANPIPEPGGFWLFGMGSIFLSWRLRGLPEPINY